MVMLGLPEDGVEVAGPCEGTGRVVTTPEGPELELENTRR